MDCPTAWKPTESPKVAEVNGPDEVVLPVRAVFIWNLRWSRDSMVIPVMEGH